MRRVTRHKAETIAFCGTRGLPARYGGFETAVHEITRRMTAGGYECEVFCRRSASRSRSDYDKGRKLRYVNGCAWARLDTFLASIQTGWHLLRYRRRYRHVFWFNNANLPGILMTRLAGIPMTVNTDGLEWRRAKWSWPFKAYCYLASLVTARLVASVVSDSRALQAYYQKRFHADTHLIPYGVPETPEVTTERERDILASLSLQPRQYFLQITRIEPDNLPLEIAEAFVASRAAKDGFEMVSVGYRRATPYARKLKALHGQLGVRVMNAIYDPVVLYVLRKNCFGYIHGNSVGGTNPALLEAMAVCPRILALDCAFNREVLGNQGAYFDAADIAAGLEILTRADDAAAYLRRRVHGRYQWNAVSRSYARLSRGLEADYSPSDAATINAAVTVPDTAVEVTA